MFPPILTYTVCVESTQDKKKNGLSEIRKWNLWHNKSFGMWVFSLIIIIGSFFSTFDTLIEWNGFPTNIIQLYKVFFFKLRKKCLKNRLRLPHGKKWIWKGRWAFRWFGSGTYVQCSWTVENYPKCSHTKFTKPMENTICAKMPFMLFVANVSTWTKLKTGIFFMFHK